METEELRISPLKLGLSYAGCFLGVGYISGQELWTFFGGYGVWGFVGAALVLLTQYVSGLMLIRLANITGANTIDKLVVRTDIRPLRSAVNFIQCLMMFFAMTVMVAGSGALIQQIFALPPWLGCTAFCLFIGYVAYKGLGTLMRVFSTVVPVLTGVSVLVCILTLAGTDWGSASLIVWEARSDFVMSRWYFAALLFFSYNMFAAIGVLTPIGNRLRDFRISRRGIALGCVVLTLMTFGVLSAITLRPETIQAELPMLAVASGIHTVLGSVFAILLLGGMFGTASNCSLYTLDFLGKKTAFARRHRLLTVLGMMLVAFGISSFGFSGLISTMYPIFGYFGVVLFAGLIEHYFYCLRHRSDQ